MKTPRLAQMVLIPFFATLSCMNTPTNGLSDLGGSHDLSGRTAKQHRPVATACSMTRAPGPSGITAGPCKMDSDCTDTTKGSNGRCVTGRGGSQCSYDECFDDSTCMGKVCLCRPAGETTASLQAHHCLTQGGCRTDNDCGTGGTCSPSFSTCGSYTGVVAYYCHTPKDDCLDDADCNSGGFDGGLVPIDYCMFSPEGGKWVCSNSQCVG
jgi:hypothetical protein